MKLGSYLKGRDYFYLMHVSYGPGREKDRERLWNYAKENKVIGLDLPKEVRKNWKDLTEFQKQSIRRRRPMWFWQFEFFCTEMKVGDLVVVVNGWDSLLGVAKIKKAQTSLS